MIDHNNLSERNTNQAQKRTQKSNTEFECLQTMRWFILIVLSSGFLGTIAACIIIRSPFPAFLTLIMSPVITWLFPAKQPSKFSLILQILLEKQNSKKHSSP